MSAINWGRFVIGGLVAAVICFVTDGFLHEMVLKADWQAAYDSLHASSPPHDPMAFFYFGVFEVGRGFGALFLYVLMRERFGAGVKTAFWAGVVSWLAFSVTGPVQFVPLGFFSLALWLKAAGVQFATQILATIVGFVIYRDYSRASR